MILTAESHVFSAGRYRACVAALGAELCSLCDETGRNLIWTGSAWPRHSPVLFPIIGRLRDNHTLIDGLDYTLTQHGFARDSVFRWLDRSDAGCSLLLEDDPTSRSIFPFAFRLVLTYLLDDLGLHLTYSLTNPDDRNILHASLGAHPAFIWPLVASVPKDHYFLQFENPETGALAAIEEGLIVEGGRPNPVEGTILSLKDALFANDALVFLNPASRSVVLTTGRDEMLLFSWWGFGQFGVWMKPGTDFLCLEPWQGYASPVGFSGPFEEKPGLLHLMPGSSWEAGWSARLDTTAS